MAKYLLNAPDEDMAEWKRLAKSWGIPFARFLRLAANFAAENPADVLGAPAPTAGGGSRVVEFEGAPPARIVPVSTEVKTDFKRGKK